MTSTGTGLVPATSTQRGRQPLVGEQPRVDAAGQLEQGVHRLGRCLLLGGEEHVGALRRTVRQRLGEPQVHGERDEVLLGTVVDVTLQTPALRVLGVHHPLTRGAQLPGTRGQLDQPALQLGAEPGAAQHQPGLARQPGEQPLLDRGQRHVLPLLDHEHAEQLPALAHLAASVAPARRRPRARVRPPRAPGWRPVARSRRAWCGHPRPATPGSTPRRCRRRAPAPSGSGAPRSDGCSRSARTGRGRRTARAGRRARRAMRAPPAGPGPARRPGRRRRWPAPRASRRVTWCGR